MAQLRLVNNWLDTLTTGYLQVQLCLTHQHLLKRKALTLHVSIVEVLLCVQWSVVKTLPSSNSYFKMNRDCALRILDTKRLTGAVSATEAGRDLLHRIELIVFCCSTVAWQRLHIHKSKHAYIVLLPRLHTQPILLNVRYRDRLLMTHQVIVTPVT